MEKHEAKSVWLQLDQRRLSKPNSDETVLARELSKECVLQHIRVSPHGRRSSSMGGFQLPKDQDEDDLVLRF